MKKPQKVTATQIETIRQLASEGVNPYQIAKKVGISNAVARYHVLKINGSKTTVRSTRALNKATVMTTIPNQSELQRENAELRQKNKTLIEMITKQLSA